MDERRQDVSRELDSTYNKKKSEGSWMGDCSVLQKARAFNNVSVYEAPEAGAEKVETIAPDTTSTESALAESMKTLRNTNHSFTPCSESSENNQPWK